MAPASTSPVALSKLLSPSKGRKKTTFFDLPPEIRNEVYAYLLLLGPPKYLLDFSAREPIYPQILRASRQTYAEALPILYRQNTFYAHPSRLDRLPQIRRWLDPVAGEEMERVRKMIRRFHISMRLECDAHFSAEEAETAFNGKDALTIQVYASQFRGSGGDVLRLFEGVRGVRTVDIYGEVSNWPKYVKSLREAMMSPLGAVVAIDRREFGSKLKLEEDSDSGVDVGDEDLDGAMDALDLGQETEGVAVGYG